jgi:hypothetical protein
MNLNQFLKKVGRKPSQAMTYFQIDIFWILMLWGIPSQWRFFISSDLGQQVPQHDVGAKTSQSMIGEALTRSRARSLLHRWHFIVSCDVTDSFLFPPIGLLLCVPTNNHHLAPSGAAPYL